MPTKPTTHVDDPVAVGVRLKEAREAAGLSQRKLSFPGCSPGYISRIEAGDRIPSLHLLRELGARLGVSEDWLATGSEGRDEVERLLLDAELALRLDELDEAEATFHRVLKLTEDTRLRARALSGLGQVAFRRDHVTRAVARFEEALALAPRAEDAALADSLGRCYADLGDYPRAIEVFERSLEGAREAGETAEEIRFAVLLANALVDYGRFADAQILLGRTLALTEQLHDPLVRARLYWSQSRLHALQARPDTAANYARKALEILELTEHTQYFARVHYLMAYVENERGHAEEALELLTRGEALLGDGAGEIDRARFRLEEARALAAMGELDRAAAVAMSTSSVFSKADPVDAGRSYAALAGVFVEHDDRERARELYELAVELLESRPNPFLAGVYAQLSELLEADGRTDEALALLRKAVRHQSAPARTNG